MGVVTGQFSQMGLAGGQKSHALYTKNPLIAPPDLRELYAPPPEIRLLLNLTHRTSAARSMRFRRRPPRCSTWA
ncbi:hypothetical protein DFH11DRAFT_1677794 [Phellopilus nigrolimitatus]|nr:hypothetical protein DFH11DRAFT_1683570 [Phellopilus nigrolimitatus]KAH8096927.1 hypothetical protein DFH11DRAFT_1677794 [Phellopilus nigrolimitatus]